MTFTIPAPPAWWPYVLLSIGGILLLVVLLRAGTLQQLATLWVKSFLENERFSPRLLTILFFVVLTGFLEVKVFQSDKAEALLLVYGQIIFANLSLVTVLLGAGKLADTYKTVQLEKKTTPPGTVSDHPVNAPE